MNDNTDNSKIAVVYTDGSARPQNGYIGWGAHGYIYDTSGIDVKTGNRHTKYVMSDVGYVENGDRLKIPHTIVSPINYFDWTGGTSYNGTNNVAELLAIIKSLEKLYELKVFNILIKADSIYALTILGKMWDIDKDRDSIVSAVTVNKDYWIRIKNILDKFIEVDAKMSFVHVKAHGVHLGNNRADKLALLGRKLSEKGVPEDKGVTEYDILNVLPAKGYWKPKVERHPFMTFKQVFFFDGDFDTNTYSIMNYKDETEIGKKNLASYGIIYLKEGLDRIKELGRIYKEEYGSLISATTVRLDTLYSSTVTNLYNSFGNYIYCAEMRGRKKTLSVLRQDEDLNESLIMNDIIPQGLSKIAESNTMLLDNVMSSYLKDNTGTDARLYIDITDQFYDIGDKMTLRSDFVNTTLIYKIPVNVEGTEVKIPLTVNADIPGRNFFKKLEKYSPKVTLVCINYSKIKIDYFTIIELDNGDKMIYCNFYSNSLFLSKKK